MMNGMRKGLSFLLSFALMFTLLGTGILVSDNEIHVDASSSATSSSSGGSSGGGIDHSTEASGEYTYEKYTVSSGTTGPGLKSIMDTAPLFYKSGDTYTQLLCTTISGYAYYFHLSGTSYSNYAAMGYGYDPIDIRDSSVMNNLYRGTPSGSSSSGSEGGSTVTTGIAQDGSYSAPVTVYKYKKGKLDKTYHGTVYVQVENGKIAGLGVSGSDKMSKVINSDIYYAYYGKEASVEALRQVDAVTSSSISSSGGTGAHDAVSSATTDTSKKKYYTSNLQQAILTAIEEAPKVEIPVEEEEPVEDLVYIGSAEVHDEEGSAITLNIYTSEGVISNITIDEETSVGTWYSLLGKVKNNYVGKTVQEVQQADAVSGATKYSETFDEAVRVALEEGSVPNDDTMRVAGYTLSLSGNIALNFYMQLGVEVLKDTGSYMKFTLPGTNHTDETVPLAQGRKVTRNGKKYVVFSAGVAAKNMTDEIKGQYFCSDGTSSVENTATIRMYCEKIIANNGGRYSEKSVELAKAIENYGGYAQLSFGYNTDKLANADKDYPLPEIDLDSIADPVKSGACTGAKYLGTTAMLTTTTGLRHYFKLDGDAADYSFTVDGKELEVGSASKGAYVLIDDIWAKNLGDPIQLTVTNKEDGTTFTLSYSVYNYVKQALKGKSTRSEMKNMVKALYGYGEAAKSYFADN